LDIRFQSEKLRSVCNDVTLRQRTFGERTSKVLGRRLDDFRAAGSLAHVAKLPAARCHELKGERVGQLAVDLDHPRRLVFEPADPRPLRDDGGLDWSKVTSIIIVEIVDYH
jgi:plasmid maintenance system killer protein